MSNIQSNTGFTRVFWFDGFWFGFSFFACLGFFCSCFLGLCVFVCGFLFLLKWCILHLEVPDMN